MWAEAEPRRRQGAAPAARHSPRPPKAHRGAGGRAEGRLGGGVEGRRSDCRAAGRMEGGSAPSTPTHGAGIPAAPTHATPDRCAALLPVVEPHSSSGVYLASPDTPQAPPRAGCADRRPHRGARLCRRRGAALTSPHHPETRLVVRRIKRGGVSGARERGGGGGAAGARAGGGHSRAGLNMSL